MLLFLQITVSVIFFLNKILMLMGKKSGWVAGMVAALFAFVYFYLLGLYVYVALEVGILALMGYKRFLEHKTPSIEAWIRVGTGVIMVYIASAAFRGRITVIELVSSLFLLIGTYLLTHGRPRTGWALYVVAHGLAAMLGFHKSQTFFADLQIASVVVALVGMLDPPAEKQ